MSFLVPEILPEFWVVLLDDLCVTGRATRNLLCLYEDGVLEAWTRGMSVTPSGKGKEGINSFTVVGSGRIYSRVIANGWDYLKRRKDRIYNGIPNSYS